MGKKPNPKHDRLFLETLNELRGLVMPRSAEEEAKPEGEAYSLTRASGPLRQLLLDTGTPLIHLANRGRNLAITFPVLGPNHPPPVPRERLHMQWSPAIFNVAWARPGGLLRPQELKKDQFLSTVVLRHLAYDITVKDIIKFEAHISGGVHHAEPKSDAEKVLDEINNGNTVAGVPIAANTLVGIIGATLRGLAPLEAQVARELGEPEPEALPDTLRQPGQGPIESDSSKGLGFIPD
jgi:hypothetical protein